MALVKSLRGLEKIKMMVNAGKFDSWYITIVIAELHI